MSTFSQVHPQNQSLCKHKPKPVYTNIKPKISKSVPSIVIPLSKEHMRLGHAGIVDHSISISLINTKLKKNMKKGMESNNKK